LNKLREKSASSWHLKFLGPFNLKELYQIMVILWVFTPCGKGFADVSEDSTVSVFRMTVCFRCMLQ